MRFLFTKSSKEIKLKGYSQINSFNIDTNLCNNIFRKNDTKIYLKHKAFLNLKLLDANLDKIVADQELSELSKKLKESEETIELLLKD